MTTIAHPNIVRPTLRNSYAFVSKGTSLITGSRHEQDESFRKIRDQQNGEFQKTVESFAKVIARSEESIEAATGGKSFAVIWVSKVRDDHASLEIVHRGKYAIRSLRLEFINREKQDALLSKHPPPTIDQILAGYQVETVGDLSFVAQPLQTELDLSNAERVDFTISFIALNGLWTELTQFRKVNGVWTWAVRVQRGNPDVKHGGTILQEDIFPGFPLKKERIDWSAHATP